MDGDLIAEARRLRPGSNDATLLDEALRSLAARNRAREIDADYAAYDSMPPDKADEWGSLGAFREAAGSS